MAPLPWDEKFDSILRAYSRLAPAEAIDPYVPFDLLGIDSVGLLGVIVDSEEVFEVEFPSDLLVGDVLATPGSLWKAVRELMPAP